MALFEEGISHGLRPRGSYDVKIRYEGDWVRFGALINNVDVLLVTAAKDGQRRFAEAYKKAVKVNIGNGGVRFGYPPNNPRYSVFKEEHGGVNIPMRWSDTMMNSVEVLPNAKGTRLQVGIPKGIRRPTYYKGDSNELEVHEIANISEHGYSLRGIPARPVFGDTFKQTMGGKAGLVKYIEKSIIKTYGVFGVRVTRKLR
jgi:hypothetical protein